MTDGKFNMSEYQKTVKFDRMPVNINNGYIHICTKNGKVRKFPSKQAKEWREEIAWAFKRQPDKKSYGIEIIVEMADKRKRDVDSGVKFILDALNGIIWEDDDQVTEVHLHKSRGHQTHKTIVSVYEI